MAITSASLPAKKRILTVCVRLFLEKGYKRSTLAEIIEKAEVSYSTFQNIFRATHVTGRSQTNRDGVFPLGGHRKE